MYVMLYSYLVIITTVIVKSTVFSETFRIKQEHLNKHLVGHVLFESIVPGLHTCVSDCMFLGACESINFISVTSSCEMNDICSDVASPGELVTEQGTIFADITEFPQTMAGGCADHTCGFNERCYPVGSSYLCAGIDCGTPPPINNGKLGLDSSSTALGATASVICNSGYAPQAPSTVCMASGKWEEATCLGNALIGEPCWLASDCKDPNARCVIRYNTQPESGVCICCPYFSLDNTTGYCGQICASYTSEFEVRGEWFYSFNIEDTVQMSFESCKEGCIEMENCLGMLYDDTEDRCVTKLLTLQQFRDVYGAGRTDVTNFVFYERKCL